MFRHLKLTMAMLALAGCHSMPTSTELPNEDELTASMIRDWEERSPAPVQYVDIGASIVSTSPQALPEEIANRPFEISFSENVKLSSLHAFLKPEGLSVVIPDPEIRNLDLVIFEFKGKLGDFLNALGVAYGITFNWHPGDILSVEKTSQYVIKVPQDEELIEEVSTAIVALGAEEIGTSLAAGSISYRAPYSAHQRIAHYINEISINAAVITLQAAIVTVSMDRSRDSGFDWSQLQARVGDLSIDDGDFGFNPGAPATPQVPTPGTGDGTGGGGTGQQPTTPAPTPDRGVNLEDVVGLVSASQQGAGIVLKKGDLDVRAVLRLLSTYGETETTQSVLMKTLSGKPVRLQSSQQIPYVAEIGSTMNTNANNPMGGFTNNRVQIEDLDVGLMFELEPFFDAHTGLVTVGVNVELSSLISFIEISAGNEVGNITRPNTQKQSFTDMLRILPGQSVIIGGLMYDQMSDNRSSISLAERLPIASKSIKSTRNALFILLRPTVTVFGEQGGQL